MAGGRRTGWSSQAGEVVDRLFAYGTFRAGEGARSMLDAYIERGEPATSTGRIYAFPSEGFPGLVNTPDGHVVGELLHLRELAAALALLDAYEGQAFRRILKGAVRADGSSCFAWCYVLANAEEARQGIPIASGDWVRWRTGVE